METPDHVTENQIDHICISRKFRRRGEIKDKRDYIDNLANQAEEAAGKGNLKDLYQVTKKLAGKFQQTDKPVKDKNGHH
nr:hypothetical protein BaRGS_032454 [Batillaria attramentaria]